MSRTRNFSFLRILRHDYDVARGAVGPNPKEVKMPRLEDIANRKDIPDMELEAAHQIWTRKQLGIKRTPKEPDSSTNKLFDHPYFAPKQPFDTSVIITPPLKWPEYDQSMLSAQQMNLPSPPYWNYHEIEAREDSAVGDYPRYVPMQYAELRDPFKYWDQQNRRDFGEIMYDHANVVGIMGVGPLPHYKSSLVTLLKFFAIVFGTWGVLKVLKIDERRLEEAVPDYPFDGLRVEQGGDPNDPTHYRRKKFAVFEDHGL